MHFVVPETADWPRQESSVIGRRNCVGILTTYGAQCHENTDDFKNAELHFAQWNLLDTGAQNYIHTPLGVVTREEIVSHGDDVLQ